MQTTRHSTETGLIEKKSGDLQAPLARLEDFWGSSQIQSSNAKTQE